MARCMKSTLVLEGGWVSNEQCPTFQRSTTRGIYAVAARTHVTMPQRKSLLFSL